MYSFKVICHGSVFIRKFLYKMFSCKSFCMKLFAKKLTIRFIKAQGDHKAGSYFSQRIRLAIQRATLSASRARCPRARPSLKIFILKLKVRIFFFRLAIFNILFLLFSNANQINHLIEQNIIFIEKQKLITYWLQF